MKKFIVHWGEMGTKWGVNRTVAQIHALLYIYPNALNAEEIANSLKIARSNVSSSLKELQNWGIVKVVHQFGDRRDHYESLKDVCETFRVILDERKKREIDPTLQMLRECVEELNEANEDEKYCRERLKDYLSFFETTSLWYERMRKMPMDKVMGLMQLEQKLLNPLK